jgi:hypothetical protein
LTQQLLDGVKPIPGEGWFAAPVFGPGVIRESKFDASPLSLFRCFRLGFSRCGHKRYKGIPDRLLHGVFG